MGPVAGAADEDASVGPITEGARPVAGVAGRDTSIVGPVAGAAGLCDKRQIKRINTALLCNHTSCNHTNNLSNLDRIENTI